VTVALAAAIACNRALDPQLSAVVQRGALTATVTASGTVRPLRSLTYRSPIPGRDTEIRELAPEGTRVNEGDPIVRLDTTDLERERDRATQELEQARIDAQVAEGEWEEAGATLKAVAEGEGALTVEEAKATLQNAERRVDRLRQEFSQMKPLLEKGFITREELAKTSDQLEEAEAELVLARKRTEIVVQMTHPRERQRATVLLSQKTSQLARARARVQETEARRTAIDELIDACSIRAFGEGLVVYEEFLGANPRRKVRVGDRVYSTQGIITIPEVNRMVVETSVSEAEVRRVRPGQAAAIRVEAFPDLKLTGTVSRVGTLATTSINRPFEEKRFDLIINLDQAPAELRPEMTARVDVVVGSKSNVLIAPVTAIFEHQGRSMAYVIGSGGIDARVVEPGESNDQLVEIVGGLREGERVSLTRPASAPLAPASARPVSDSELRRGQPLAPMAPR
jgi:HlyD family secretion protein